MDDVLSSIRRIIGAEKRAPVEDDDESGADKYHVPPVPDQDDGPLQLGASLDNSGGGSAPLSLSQDMRVGFGELGGGRRPHDATPDPGASAAPDPGAVPDPIPLPVRQEQSLPAEPDDPEGGDALVIDEAALEDMIRRIVRDEIQEALPSRDEMRNVVHEELHGEVGQRISKNVLKMIQAEVGRLLRGN